MTTDKGKLVRAAYEDMFGVPAEGNAYQDSLHAIACQKQSAAANLLLQAAINHRYAQANRQTHARTGGRLGSLYMAEVHEACAQAKKARAESLFPSEY